MASNVNSIITANDLGGGLIPTEYATQIIQDAPKSSVSLTRMRQIRMSTRTRVQPVLDSKPIAYWVGGDTGLKQTTKQAWSGLSITAEEMAAIVPIPEAVIADSGIQRLITNPNSSAHVTESATQPAEHNIEAIRRAPP